MAKNKIKELEYKIEGLRRMKIRKIKRARMYRIKSLENLKKSLINERYFDF